MQSHELGFFLTKIIIIIIINHAQQVENDLFVGTDMAGANPAVNSPRPSRGGGDRIMRFYCLD